jgi:hypothetical protein
MDFSDAVHTETLLSTFIKDFHRRREDDDEFDNHLSVFKVVSLSSFFVFCFVFFFFFLFFPPFCSTLQQARYLLDAV